MNTENKERKKESEADEKNKNCSSDKNPQDPRFWGTKIEFERWAELRKCVV